MSVLAVANRVLREYFDYTGRTPSSPAGFPLPFGVPPGVHNPSKAELRELFGGIDEAVLDASDSASAAIAAKDLAEGFASDIVAQGNVPVYSTAATVAGLTIPAGQLFIQTGGWQSLGDGGGAYYKRDSVASPGSIQDASGAHFKLIKRATDRGYAVEAFGATGGSNDTIAFERARDSGEPLILQRGRTYTISELAVSGRTIWGGGGVIAYDASHSGDVPPYSLDNVRAEELVFQIPANVTNNRFINIQSSCKIGALRVQGGVGSPAQIANSIGADIDSHDAAVRILGSDNEIGLLQVLRIDRMIFMFGGATMQSDNWIGFIRGRTFSRGIRITDQRRLYIGGVDFRIGSPNLPDMAPGQNGILMSGVQESYIGDVYVEGAGEHAVRIGGEDFDNWTADVTFGTIKAKRPRGCAFKINPDGAAQEIVRRVNVGRLIGVDVGNQDGGISANACLARLTRCRDVSIGRMENYVADRTVSAHAILALADVQRLTVGGFGGFLSEATPVQITDDQDGVQNVVGRRMCRDIDFGRMAFTGGPAPLRMINISLPSTTEGTSGNIRGEFFYRVTPTDVSVRVRIPQGVYESIAITLDSAADPGTQDILVGAENVDGPKVFVNRLPFYRTGGNDLTLIPKNGNIRAEAGSSFVFPTYSGADLANASHPINTTGKVIGKAVRNATTDRLMIANGTAPNSAWKDATGGNTITPS